MTYFWWIIAVIPKRVLSRIVGIIVNLKLPDFLRKASVVWFAKRYGINTDEAEFTIDKYNSIGEFFIRKLKQGLRPLNGDFIHPVDGKLTQIDKIQNFQMIQAKKWNYSLNEFVSDDHLNKYIDGDYLIYYLCPTDYHRVHSPIDGQIRKVKYIPGALWPVNDWSVNNIKNLFVKNERLIFYIDTKFGEMLSVMVGATNVGKMTVSFSEDFQPNPSWLKGRVIEHIYSSPIQIKCGDELGIFHMGSTVVNVFPKGVVSRDYVFDLPISVKLGEKFNF